MNLTITYVVRHTKEPKCVSIDTLNMKFLCDFVLGSDIHLSNIYDCVGNLVAHYSPTHKCLYLYSEKHDNCKDFVRLALILSTYATSHRVGFTLKERWSHRYEC